VRDRVWRAAAGGSLRPVFASDIHRTRRILREQENEVELCLDVGEIATDSQRVEVRELELELCQGSSSFPYEIALALSDSDGLRPARESKAERGYTLLTGERPGPQKARPLQLDRKAVLPEVLSAVVTDCLAQVRANEAPALDGTDPEGVHQLRVGVRRLRTALRLFRPLLPREPVRELSAELRWLGRELGPARDLDVFVDELIGPLVRAEGADPALATLRDAAIVWRGECRARARAALLSPRYSRLVLRLGHWLASAAWRDQPLGEQSARLYLPAAVFTSELFDRQHRKIVRMGRRLERASIEERHLLRIRLKRLRYAAEFFRSLYPAKRSRRYIRRLARLQDRLGELNDVAMADRVLAKLLSRVEPAPVNQHAAGFVAGWKASVAERRLSTLGSAWRRFAAAPRFWRDG
jgi:CHAD domain-containing protein